MRRSDMKRVLCTAEQADKFFEVAGAYGIYIFNDKRDGYRRFKVWCCSNDSLLDRKLKAAGVPFHRTNENNDLAIYAPLAYRRKRLYIE